MKEVINARGGFARDLTTGGGEGGRPGNEAGSGGGQDPRAVRGGSRTAAFRAGHQQATQPLTYSMATEDNIKVEMDDLALQLKRHVADNPEDFDEREPMKIKYFNLRVT